MKNKQEILNELNELSPFIFNLKKNEKGLIFPENYFNELAEVVLFEINNEEHFLSGLKKEKIEIPTNYFENFSEDILSKIKNEEQEISQGKLIVLPKKQHKIVHLFSRVAMAASIVGAVFLVKEVQKPAKPMNDCKDGIACLTPDEIYNYMNVNSHDFEVQEVQETVKPTIENLETKDVVIDKKEATQYIEANKIILELDDASTDIF